MTTALRTNTVSSVDESVFGDSYEITVAASFAHDWAAWFDGWEVQAKDAVTVLRGRGVDQAALHGLLARLRDLGVPLLEVRVDATPAEDSPEQADGPPASGSRDWRDE